MAPSVKGKPASEPSATGEPDAEVKSADTGADGVFSRLSELAWQALPALGSAAGFVGFVAAIGAAIEWTRFNAADLPATQGLLAVPRQELVIIGALALGAFMGGALLAVLLVYLIDNKGDATVATVRGIVLVGFVEMVVTLFYVDLNHTWTYFALGVWLVLIGLAAADVVGVTTRHFGKRGKLKAARHRVVDAGERLAVAADARKVADEPDGRTPGPLEGGGLISKLRKRIGAQSSPPAPTETGDAVEHAFAAGQLSWKAAVKEWVELVAALTLDASSLGKPSPADTAAGVVSEENPASHAADQRADPASPETDRPIALASRVSNQQSLLEWCAARRRSIRERRVREANTARDAITRSALESEPLNSFELERELDRAESAQRNVRSVICIHLAGQIAALRWTLKQSGAGYTILFVLLAGALVGLSVVQITTDKSIAWLSIELGVVAVLALTNVFVARATTKFAWYGISVFFTVLTFGATLTIARTLARPTMQPIALVRTSDDVGICGVYITQTNDRVYVGRLPLKTKPTSGGPLEERRPGLIFWVSTSDVDLVSVGRPEQIGSRFPTLSAALLRQLYKDRAEEPTSVLKNETTTKVVNEKAKPTEAKGEQGTTTNEKPPVRVPHRRHPHESVGGTCTSLPADH